MARDYLFMCDLTLPTVLIDAIEQRAMLDHSTKNEVVRQAIEAFLSQYHSKPLDRHEINPGGNMRISKRQIRGSLVRMSVRLPKCQLDGLHVVAKEVGLPRAAIVRYALSDFLELHSESRDQNGQAVGRTTKRLRGISPRDRDKAKARRRDSDGSVR